MFGQIFFLLHKQTNVTQRRRLIFYFDGSHKNGAKLKYKHYKKKNKDSEFTKVRTKKEPFAAFDSTS